jgi:hypothetical protein
MANGDANGVRLRKQMALIRLAQIDAELAKGGNYYQVRDLHLQAARLGLLVNSIATSS